MHLKDKNVLVLGLGESGLACALWCVRQGARVRVLDTRKGTAANVRVLIEWSDHRRSWSTVGVSDNVIEASWKALVDAIRLELMRLTEKDDSIERAVEDYCWGV